MRRALRSLGPSARALAVAWLGCLALAACEEGDPLQHIRQQQATGDYAGSIEPLRAFLAEHGDHAEANYLYGRALVATQAASLALWPLRKAMEDPEWLVPAGIQLALDGLNTQDFNVVVETTSRILEREPDNTQALLLRAQAQAYWRKEPERALEDASRVLEIDPDLIEAHEPRILALLALGRLDEAGAALEEVGRRIQTLEAPEDLEAWHCATSAIFAQESGEIERAGETWSRCLETHPSHFEVVWKALRFYDARGEPQRSIAILRTALAEVPEAQAYRTELAERLRLAGEFAEAEAVLREATDVDDPQVAAQAWLDLSRLRQLLGEYAAAADAAEQAYERAREAGTPTPDLVLAYANALVQSGRLERASRIAEELSVPAQRHLILGRIAQEEHNPALALEEFDESLRLWPDNVLGRYYAARAAEDLGDFEQAIEEYRYALRISPGATDARTRIAALMAAQHQAVLAFPLLRMAPDQPLDHEGELLSFELAGLLGRMPAVQQGLAMLAESVPQWVGPGAARAAEGVARRAGPAAAIEVLRGAPGIDFDDPRHAAALRALVRFAHEAGDPAQGQAALRSALEAHPDVAAFHAIRGLDLELSGAPVESVRAAHQRALELDPAHAPSLLALGRLDLPRDPGAALARLDRAAAADPSDPEPKLLAARALVALGRPDESARRLDALLVQHPYEAEAAALRAQLDLDRQVATEQTLERARRAVRFGGGAEALELLSRVHAQRSEPEEAERAAERARALRETAAAGG